MVRHGWTVKYCNHCGKFTSHSIVESTDEHVKVYICLDLDHNLDEKARQAKQQEKL
jgi:hypothetical protein